jgi:hypothetical protein
VKISQTPDFVYAQYWNKSDSWLNFNRSIVQPDCATSLLSSSVKTPHFLSHYVVQSDAICLFKSIVQIKPLTLHRIVQSDSLLPPPMGSVQAPYSLFVSVRYTKMWRYTDTDRDMTFLWRIENGTWWLFVLFCQLVHVLCIIYLYFLPRSLIPARRTELYYT